MVLQVTQKMKASFGRNSTRLVSVSDSFGLGRKDEIDTKLLIREEFDETS